MSNAIMDLTFAVTISKDSLDNVQSEGTESTFTASFLKVLKGDKGDTGATGPQGPQGPAGATGPQGPAGHPLIISTSINSNGHLIVSQNNDGQATFALQNKHLIITL